MTNTYLPLSAARIKKAISLSKDVWLSDSPGTRGYGQLLARVTRRGICRFYFRYSRNGTRKTVSLGRYARIRTEGFLTLRDARNLARGLSARLQPPISLEGIPVTNSTVEALNCVARGHDLLAVVAPHAEGRQRPDLAGTLRSVLRVLRAAGQAFGKTAALLDQAYREVRDR